MLCSLPVIYLGPNYGGDDEDNGDLLQNIPCMLSVPPPSSRLPLTHASTRVSWTLTAKSGSVSCESLLLSPGSWCTQGSVCALQEPAFPVLCKFWRLCGGLNGYLLQEDLCHAQVCCIQSPCPCSSPLLTWTSAGDTQTQFCLNLCGVSGSWGWFEHLWQVWGLILNAISPLLPSCCRAAQKGHSGFSVSCKGKTQMNFLANPII